MTKEKDITRLYAIARKTAMDAAGGERAFWIIGSTLRQALVAQAVLQILDQQDDDGVTDAAVRTLLHGLRSALRDDESLLA